MSLIDKATQRLEELSCAGVAVPWAAAGLEQSDLRERVESKRPRRSLESTPVAAMRRVALQATSAAAVSLPTRHPPIEERADTEPTVTVTLDLERLERLGHIISTQTRSTQAEEFRQIKRPLLKNARGDNAVANRLSLIMVTSALPREGKTFCSINLAMSMAAEIDTSVLLVDADVVRPEMLGRLGLSPCKGLLDVLTDPHLKLSDVILKTNVPKLSILSSGTPNSMSTELLASEAMEALLVSLATRHPDRIVIFDAPPLLVTNEAKVLASRVGQVVMVVTASSTPRKAAEQAFAAVEQCPIVLSVLNKAHEPAVPGGYGYYYG